MTQLKKLSMQVAEEIKLKCLAVYMGSNAIAINPIFRNHEGDDDSWRYQGIVTIDILRLAKQFGTEALDIRLILKDPKDISDEDMVGMMATCKFAKGYIENPGIDYIKELISRFDLDLLLHDYSSIAVAIIDYLRSKGYHIPYMGIDLYEAGIAIKA